MYIIKGIRLEDGITFIIIEHVMQAVMQQVPVSIQNPGAKASQAYQRIAERMCEKEDDTAQEQQPRRGMAAFFSHIIGTRNGATKQSR